MDTKHVLKFAKDEFVYGGHLLGLGAVSIVVTSALILNIGITWDFLLIVYLMIYIVYSYDRLSEIKNDLLTNLSRTEHIERGMNILPAKIYISISVITLILIRFSNFYAIVFCYLLIGGSISYAKYFKNITRRISGFKSFYVTFFWASLTVFLALYYGYEINLPLILMFIFIYLRIFVNAIFCDIKDIESDQAKGLKTIPVVLGRKKTLVLLHIINLISFVPLIYGVYYKHFPSFSFVLVIFYFYSFYYLILGKKENVDIQKITYIIVDGEYIFWLFLVGLTIFFNL